MATKQKPARQPLTKRQRHVLETLCRIIELTGDAPSVRELATAAGIGSGQGALVHLRMLEKKCYIRRTPGAARAIHVLD